MSKKNRTKRRSDETNILSHIKYKGVWNGMVFGMGYPKVYGN